MNYGIAVKLDISKTYECIEWSYLEHMLECFGFSALWMMTCVSTASYSVQINGHKTGFIRPSREIWQGDPLSLYLFLICAEGLSHKIKTSNIQGLHLSRHEPILTHLLFVDDTITYARASSWDAEEIKSVLYERASGQSISLANPVFLSALIHHLLFDKV